MAAIYRLLSRFAPEWYDYDRMVYYQDAARAALNHWYEMDQTDDPGGYYLMRGVVIYLNNKFDDAVRAPQKPEWWVF